MRNIYIQELLAYVENHQDVMLLTGDLGFSVFEEFIRKFPKQFINCGVAEQSMTGIAAGLASEGYYPIIYSIIPFVTMRNFEQIRNDICYQQLPVMIVGVGAGFMYGPYGHTHHALEDIAVLRTLPNLTILAPGDQHEVRALTRQALQLHQPVYLRLGRVEDELHTADVPINIGTWNSIRKGNDAILFATSTMVSTAAQVATHLKTMGIDLTVVSSHTVAPIHEQEILRFVNPYKIVITLEEHFVSGGLSTIIAEVLGKHGEAKIMKSFGVPHAFPHVHGLQPYMRQNSGLSREHLVGEIKKLFP